MTSDMLQDRVHWYGGVSEAYWVSSQGVAVRVRRLGGASSCYLCRCNKFVKEIEWQGLKARHALCNASYFCGKVDEQTPLFLEVPDTNGDLKADELCLSARHERPFAAAPGSPLTLTYFLCSADDVRKVCCIIYLRCY